MFNIKVKELPEKVALELSGNDNLIIEDKNNTCQIKLSELSTYIRNGLIDKDSFNQLMAEAISVLTTRLEKVENTYPFKIVNIIKTLPVNLPGKEQETSDKYIQNQNNIDISFRKTSINEYDLVVTEKAKLNSYYSGGSITSEHEWYGIIIEFNTGNSFVSYDSSQSIGNWAEIYSIDESEKTDVHIFNGVNLDTASQEDVDRTLNSVIVWLRADDSEQTLCFVDSQQLVKYTMKDNSYGMEFEKVANIIKLKVSVNKYIPEEIEKPEEEHTYGVYQWDNALGSEPDVSIKNNMLYIEFNKDVPYTSYNVDGIYTSGNWVGVTITPPIGFDINSAEYPKMYSNGTLTTEGWKNFFNQDDEGNVLEEDISKALLPIMFTESKCSVICTFDWGIGYIDNVVIATQKEALLYLPIDNL